MASLRNAHLPGELKCFDTTEENTRFGQLHISRESLFPFGDLPAEQEKHERLKQNITNATSMWEMSQDSGGSPTGSPGLGCRRLWNCAHWKATHHFSAQSICRAGDAAAYP